MAAAVLATLIRLSLDPVWGLKLPYSFYFPAIMLSGWLGGFGPGMLTTLLSAVGASYFFIPPARSWHIQDPTELLGLAVFIAFGAAISALNESWRQLTRDVLRSQERFRVTLESIGDAVITTDGEGRVRSMNRVAAELTGWGEAEAVGLPLEEVFVIRDEASGAPAESPVPRALREGVVTGLSNHTLLVARGGRVLAIDDSAAPIRTAGGEIAGVVLVFRDVSRRRADERERARLHEEEHRTRVEAETAARQLRLAVEAGRMGTWEWTLATGRIVWSPALETIHGYAPGTFAGTIDAFREEIHPEDRERVLAAIEEALAERREHHVEYRIVRRDGTIRWVEGRGQLLVDGEGRPERMTGVCLDVTERKHVEERFHLAVEASPAAMVILDREGRIVYANAQTEALLGWTRAELAGRPVEDLVPSRFRAGHSALRDAFFTEMSRRPMGAGRDLFARRKDGGEVPVEIGLSPFRTAEGAFVLASVADVTDRKRAERERADAFAREQDVARLKDEFLATLSHELRNPLAPVRSAAHVLGGRLEEDREARAAYRILERQLGHLVRLVDDLLDVSRIGRGLIELRRERIALGPLVEVALEASRPALEERRHLVSVSIPEEPVWVDADSVRLSQVITNLLNNAAKYTPEGGRVTVTVESDDGAAAVRVADDGSGFESAGVERLFEMFAQGEPSVGRPRGGLGIGLALARRLAELHGGTLEGSSLGPGRGSAFTLRLPAAPPPAPLAASGETPEAESAMTYRVLVADDNVDAAEALAMLLADAGHDVRTANDGLDACVLAESHPFDLALLDVGMPEMDGYEAARRLRGRPGGEDLVLIALTGWGQAEDRQRAREAGFDRHLTKPVDPSFLLRLLSLSRARLKEPQE